MALPVQMFPMLTPDQISPVMTGISQANQLYAQSMANQYMQPNMEAALRKAQLSNQISQAQANVAPQMNAAQLAYNQARTPNLNAQTQMVLSGQIPQMQANTGLIGTETAKNQFNLSNPETMLPPGSVASQLGSLALLKRLSPQAFGQNQAAPPTQYQNTVNTLDSGGATPIPGMPSAGKFSAAPSGSGGAFGQSGIPYSPQTGQSTKSVDGGNNAGLPTFAQATQLALDQFKAPIEKNIAQANYYNTRSSGYNNLPATEKSYMIAQAAGMGYDPAEAASLLNHGATIPQLAQEKGLDPNNLPSALYAATPQTVQLIQRRNQALSEINTIQPELTAGMAPYARQFSGYSPSQISSAIKNDKPDQQARFLAAKALLPEMASLRLKAMGGNVGIEAIKEVNNQSMGNIQSFQGLVSPQVYTAAQNYVDKWINQGASAANSVGLAGTLGNTGGKSQSQMAENQNKTQTKATTSTQKTSSSGQKTSSGRVSLTAPNGEIFNVPAENVAAAIKMGAIQQ